MNLRTSSLQSVLVSFLALCPAATLASSMQFSPEMSMWSTITALMVRSCSARAVVRPLRPFFRPAQRPTPSPVLTPLRPTAPGNRDRACSRYFWQPLCGWQNGVTYRNWCWAEAEYNFNTYPGICPGGSELVGASSFQEDVVEAYWNTRDERACSGGFWEPVCGEWNDITYTNWCWAMAEGNFATFPGECSGGTVFRGGSSFMEDADEGHLVGGKFIPADEDEGNFISDKDQEGNLVQGEYESEVEGQIISDQDEHGDFIQDEDEGGDQ